MSVDKIEEYIKKEEITDTRKLDMKKIPDDMQNILRSGASDEEKLRYFKDLHRELGESLRYYEQGLSALKEMRDEAHGEANEINDEYERLLFAAKVAAEALRNFQENKLGMKSESDG